MSPVDQLAIEGQLSKLITKENITRLAGILGGINPALGTVAGVMGAVLVRVAENINNYIESQWNRPLVPPDILIPMNYDIALRFLRTRGLADTFADEISKAESETDLWIKRQKQDVVCSIASVMDAVLNHRDRESLAFGFFDHQIKEGKYREIWDHWGQYLQAQDELKTMLPVAETQGLISIAFGNIPLKELVSEVAKSDATKALRETISGYIKQKLGLDVDLDSLVARIA